jgi:hypothetical protein
MKKIWANVRKFWKQYLVPVLLTIIGIVFYLALEANSKAAEAIVAFGTLILALVTALSILNSNEQEKRHREEELARENREKKERLLNEIIEWAIAVTNCNMEANPMSVSQTSGTSKEREFHHATLCDFANRLQAMRGRSLKIKSITSLTQFHQHQSLNEKVSELIIILEGYIKSILDCTDILYTGGASEQLRNAIDKASEIRVKMEDTAYKVIEEAVKIDN